MEEEVAQKKCPGFLERGLRDERGDFSEKKAAEIIKDGIWKYLGDPMRNKIERIFTPMLVPFDSYEDISTNGICAG